jgi:tetratricopeptide (TPR) repeat protein
MPDDAHSRRYLAETLWQHGQVEEAIGQMDAAAQCEAADSAIAVRAGEMRLATGAVDLARLRADQAIRLDPQNPRAWALRGRIGGRMNQSERALADMHRALALAPRDREVLLEIALLYRQAGQHQRCLAMLHSLLDTYPPGGEAQQVLFLEGITLSELGRHRQAADALLTASQGGPANAEILITLARAQSSAGDAESAALTARQALTVDPTHEGARQLVERLATEHSSPDTLRR